MKPIHWVMIVGVLVIAAILYFANNSPEARLRRRRRRGGQRAGTSGVSGNWWYCTYTTTTPDPETGEPVTQTVTDWMQPGGIDAAIAWVNSCNAKGGVSGSGIPPAPNQLQEDTVTGASMDRKGNLHRKLMTACKDGLGNVTYVPLGQACTSSAVKSWNVMR